MLLSGRRSFVFIEAGSGGWSLCWDYIFAEVYVVLDDDNDDDDYGIVVVIVVLVDVNDDFTFNFSFLHWLYTNNALSFFRYFAP